MHHSLIKILADGEVHSGDELGRQLGRTRAGVWKALRKLPDFGLEVESIRGKGYCLPGGLELLDEGFIRNHIDQQRMDAIHAIDLCHSVASTNDVVASRLLEGLPGAYFCLAEQQTAGRGRRGRKWISPYGRNIYLSYSWHFEQGVAALEGLSLAVGLGVAKALEKNGVASVGLKWPNDILIDGKKIGGILIELSGDAAGACQVIVGIGVNVHMELEHGNEIDQDWTSITLLGQEPQLGRNEIAGSIINELLVIMDEFERSGFACFKEDWQAKDYFNGKEVVLMIGEQTLQGTAHGIAANGALLLKTEGGVREFSGGEISLREQA